MAANRVMHRTTDLAWLKGKEIHIEHPGEAVLRAQDHTGAIAVLAPW
jgi:hypothetical protein